MIIRQRFLEEIAELFETFSVVAILAPRQSGKSTLARQYITTLDQRAHFFDLESEADQARLQEAQLSLEELQGLIVIDEIQRRPNLFPILRYLVDHSEQRYLILGSASRDLIQQSSETLAGRIAYVELPPFSIFEIDEPDQNTLWCRGGFPRSYLAASDKASYRWRQEYIKTFLERDLSLLGFNVEPVLMRRFWQMLIHYHGQTFNASELAASLGLSSKTVQRYIDMLQGTFMVRSLRPWYENIGKRQVKSSKVYIKDSGLLHTLSGVTGYKELLGHPKMGASFEGFALENVIYRIGADADDCYFWATSNQAELDLMVLKDGKRLGFEFKHTLSPKITKSMQIALQDLTLDQLTIIIPKGEAYPLSNQITVCGLTNLPCNFGV